MNQPRCKFALFWGLAVLLAPPLGAQSMTIDSLDGPVTPNEINSFKAFIPTLTPATWDTTGGMENEYAQGHSGENIKAMGLMYELSRDPIILDRMIYFCDTLLSQRNDLLAAPNGQRVYNAGTVAPAWPSALTGTPIYSTSASGDCAGHLAYCARLILQTPTLWNAATASDPFGYGATYLQRAQRYVTEADYCFDRYFFPFMLDLTDQSHLKYTASSPYQPGNQLPWNQAMMMIYPLQNLALAHSILGDNPARVANYDNIVQVNISRFFNDPTVRTIYSDPDGQPAYNWAYTPSSISGEDSNHGALDVAGFYRAFQIGRYGLTPAQMQPFANTFCDVMTRTVGSDYSGRVDGTDGTGHGAPTSYVRSGYLFVAEFRPDQYYNLLAGARLSAGGSTGSTDGFSRAMWEKNARYLASQAFTLNATPASPTVIAGNVASFTATVTPQGAFNGQVTLAVSGQPPGATVTVTPATLTGGDSTIAIATAGATTPGIYPLLVTGVSGAITQVAVVELNVTSLTQATAPTFSPPGGTYTSIQSVTLSSPTGGASIRFTTDGSTPTASVGTLYTGPVTIASNTTLKAVAYASGLTTSLVTSGTYAINLPAAATPTFSPDGDIYGGAQSVTIASDTPGASIRYTLDGSAPSATTGIPYAGPVTIGYTTTLKAIAIASGLAASPVASADYVIGDNVPANAASATTGVTDSGHASSFVPANTLDGNYGTRWASSGDGVWIQYDLGTVETLNYVKLAWYLGTARTYTFDILVSTDSVNWTTVVNRRTSSGTTTALETYNFPPTVGQFVRIVGHLSNVDAYTNIVETEVWGSPTGATPVVAAPGFSPAGGTYTTTQSVTLTSATSGAAIRYTTDGSTPTPTSGTIYSGPVAVASSATLKAIAYATGLANSLVTSASYTINNGALPAGWSDLDIGAPALAGSATYTGGVFTLKGAGADIWTTSDQFNYAFAAAGGDLTITARVATLQNTNISAKSGVMIRESTAANSRYVLMLLMPTKGVALQYRSATGGSAVQLSTNTGLLPPYWVRLVRSGNSFTGYTSPDGVAWTSRGTISIAMASTVTAGLAVCSHSTTALATSTVDNVGLVLPPTAAPLFTPAAGTYSSPQPITIASGSAGAAIRYTTDGSTPTSTTGTLYTGPVTLVPGTTRLAAIAYVTGNADSSVSTATYQIVASSPTLTWAPPADIVYGTPLSATQLNATASVAGVFSYSPAAGTMLGAGAGQTLRATFTPSDPIDYVVGGVVSTPINVTPAPATVTLGNLTATYDGTAKTVPVTTIPTGLTVTVTYNGSTTAPTNPGTYAVVATVTDPNGFGSASGTLAIASTALVRHAPAVNSGLNGSVQVASGENIALAGTAWISGDLLVPGTPTVQVTGTPVYAGTLDGTGAASPAGYSVTIGDSALLRHVVRRTDPLALPPVSAPPAPTGTRSVTLTSSTQSAGDFTTVRNLTVAGSAGLVAVPPGTYGTLSASSNSGFILGVAGATQPAIYNLQSLSLNLLPGAAQIQVVGPVIVTLAGGTILNGAVGSSAHPEWLTLQIATGGLTSTGNISLNAHLVAPNGTVTLSGSATLNGTVVADRLTLNGTSLLKDPNL